MKNTYHLYIGCQVLKLLLIIIYQTQPPSLFFSYLLFYIFLFNGFTQGDRVVSCTKMNFHHHYPLHLQNLTTLKHILKEVWGYLSFVLDQWNPLSQNHKPNYLHPFFKYLSVRLCKALINLLLTALPQEETFNSVVICILSQMIWCNMYTR